MRAHLSPLPVRHRSSGTGASNLPLPTGAFRFDGWVRPRSALRQASCSSLGRLSPGRSDPRCRPTSTGMARPQAYAMHQDGSDALPCSSAHLVVEVDGYVRATEGIAWSGGLWATLPELKVGPSGSLLLTSGNGGHGRHR